MTDASDQTSTYHLALDGDGVVTGKVQSNCPQPGMVDVDASTFGQAVIEGARYVGGALQPYTPPAVSGPPPTVTGNQWAFSLSDLGLASAWQVAITKSKASDQIRSGLIARDTPLVASDPLLVRVAGNAGADANGAPLVVVATVFTHAQGMPT